VKQLCGVANLSLSYQLPQILHQTSGHARHLRPSAENGLVPFILSTQQTCPHTDPERQKKCEGLLGPPVFQPLSMVLEARLCSTPATHTLTLFTHNTHRPLAHALTNPLTQTLSARRSVRSCWGPCRACNISQRLCSYLRVVFHACHTHSLCLPACHTHCVHLQHTPSPHTFLHTDPERQKECEELLGPLPSERFAELVALGKLITDYVGEGEAVVPNEDEGLDDDIGVAVEVSGWRSVILCSAVRAQSPTAVMCRCVTDALPLCPQGVVAAQRLLGQPHVQCHQLDRQMFIDTSCCLRVGLLVTECSLQEDWRFQRCWLVHSPSCHCRVSSTTTCRVLAAV
jgi:hypothetical protein